MPTPTPLETYVFVTKWGGSQESGDGQFDHPEGLAVDGSGNVYVSDTWNNRIQKFASSGTFLAKWSTSTPCRIGVDESVNVYVSEGDNTIGRGNGPTISLSDESMSRQHAVIRCQDGKLTLFGVGSKSGTALNGQSIGGRPITNGDVISVGRSEFIMMASKTQPVGV